MDIPLKYPQLNAHFDFILPSTPENKPHHDTKASNDVIVIVDNIDPIYKNRACDTKRVLQIQTDPFGNLLKYTSPKRTDTQEEGNTIFLLQLNFPQLNSPKIILDEFYDPYLPLILIEKPEVSSPIPVPHKPSPSSSTIGQSPAASFLANFMSAPMIVSPQNIQTSTELSENAIDEYIIGDIIGVGGFSTVRKAQYKNNTVAIKIIEQHLMNNSIDLLRLDRELSIWRSLKHPHIVRLQRLIKHYEQGALSPTFYLVSDYCSGGNLLNHLQQHRRLNERKARQLFWQLCKGVQYLHVDRQVCHKDLKLENILLDEEGRVQICDFGLTISQHHQCDDHDVEEMVGGSLAYAAPEQIQHVAPLTCPKTDIWSLGVILYALVVGSLPFDDAYELRLQQKILKGEFEMPVNVSQNLQQLISACLTYDPKKRWGIDAVLKSAWFSLK